MKDLPNIANFLAFAFGFAMGTYIGLMIEENLSIGMAILRILTTEDSTEEIVSFMQADNYGVATLDATGSRGNVKMILSLVNRVDVPCITAHLQSTNPIPSCLIKMCGMRMKESSARKNPMLSPVCFICLYDPGRKK